MIRTDYRDTIEALLNKGLDEDEVAAEMRLDEDGREDVMSVATDPATWMEEQEYLMMIRSDR